MSVSLSTIFGVHVNSTMKSTSSWPLIAVYGLNWISNSPSSVDHLVRRPEASGFWKTYFNGNLVRIMMVWAWKYGLNFHDVTMRARASFSISGFCVSASRKDLLV